MTLTNLVIVYLLCHVMQVRVGRSSFRMFQLNVGEGFTRIIYFEHTILLCIVNLHFVPNKFSLPLQDRWFLSWNALDGPDSKISVSRLWKRIRADCIRYDSHSTR